MENSKKNKKSAGFTLVELILTLGILMVLVAPIGILINHAVSSIISTMNMASQMQRESIGRNFLLGMTREIRSSFQINLHSPDADNIVLELGTGNSSAPLWIYYYFDSNGILNRFYTTNRLNINNDTPLTQDQISNFDIQYPIINGSFEQITISGNSNFLRILTNVEDMDGSIMPISTVLSTSETRAPN